MPWIPASVFALSSAKIVNTNNQFLLHDFWNGKSPSEIIIINDDIVTTARWVALFSMLFMIYAVSAVKYLWHRWMRNITDKKRKDGKIADPPSVQFFIFHTSGVAWWLAMIMLAFAMTNSFFPENRFTVIYNFFERYFWWQCALVLFVITFFVKYYESNTQIFMEVYKNENLVSKVRKWSYVIPIGLFMLLEIGGAFTAYSVLSKHL